MTSKVGHIIHWPLFSISMQRQQSAPPVGTRVPLLQRQQTAPPATTASRASSAHGLPSSRVARPCAPEAGRDAGSAAVLNSVTQKFHVAVDGIMSTAGHPYIQRVADRIGQPPSRVLLVGSALLFALAFMIGGPHFVW